MRSSVFPKPNLSSLESGVREFHHKIQEKLPVARLAEHPGEGKVGQVNDQMNFQ